MLTSPFASIPEALDDLRQGRMIILVDDEQRENEGDLILAAEKVTPEAINFMANFGRGLICVALPELHIERLQLPPMVVANQAKFGTAFTVSVGAAKGITTGISAADRAKTIQVLMDPLATKDDITSPGHVFPLSAKKAGVIARQGHTEGSVDLTRLAGLQPGGVICEIMNSDGTMARLPDLTLFAQQHKLKIISIQQLITYRKQTETLVELLAETRLPLVDYGDFTLKIFANDFDSQQHIALVKMPVLDPTSPTLVRIHSECFTGDIFGSARCDCGWQLDNSLAQIQQQGGVLIYLRQEGRGIGLLNKIKAYHLQDQGFDTIEANQQLGFAADYRDFTVAAHILRFLKIQNVCLLTNNPNKASALQALGINVSQRLPLEAKSNEHNQRYLQTKRDKLGHLLSHA